MTETKIFIENEAYSVNDFDTIPSFESLVRIKKRAEISFTIIENRMEVGFSMNRELAEPILEAVKSKKKLFITYKDELTELIFSEIREIGFGYPEDNKYFLSLLSYRQSGTYKRDE